jgi:phosphoglycolate phosphatase (TIGR01487 family)
MGHDETTVLVGGGATGAGVACDLAMRGVDVTLVDRGGLSLSTPPVGRRGPAPGRRRPGRDDAYAREFGARAPTDADVVDGEPPDSTASTEAAATASTAPADPAAGRPGPDRSRWAGPPVRTMASPPLALDIDGTLTDATGRIDPRAFDPLAAWDAPVVLATGKSFPYPVALAHFIGVPERVIAENGGVVLIDGEVRLQGDPERARAAFEAFVDRGGDPGFTLSGTTNRWRETELAVSLETADEDLLRAVADEFDLEVFDTGYAYHLKTPGVEKGAGLEVVADALGYDPGEFVAVGDSENDASTFAVAGRSFAVANADATATAAADVVLDDGYLDGTLAAIERVRDGTSDSSHG